MESPVQTNFRILLERLRNRINDTQAVVLVGPDGVVDHILADPSLNIESVVAEYAMLLRIAGRTSEDTGGGKLVEQIVVSERSVVIARSVSPQYFLILLCRTQDQIGRARYEIKQAAREIQI